MPTRKQRRREAKSKRHEYEFVYVDDEGNEVEGPPEGAEPEKRHNGAKPAAKKAAPSRTMRTRTPPEPSWQRAGRRAIFLGAIVFVLFSFTGRGSYVYAFVAALIYTALFIPFTYAIDRFAYRRWQQRVGEQPTKKR
jgi:hypothetical protein